MEVEEDLVGLRGHQSKLLKSQPLDFLLRQTAILVRIESLDYGNDRKMGGN